MAGTEGETDATLALAQRFVASVGRHDVDAILADISRGTDVFTARDGKISQKRTCE